ncbi:MAG TPA: sulfite exporter TauE/SafE family protein [Xanthobacteraceae bacterium]|nr:sulfite exporter TauE/SafE family protein [Xanthobacteraceae bacterium]
MPIYLPIAELPVNVFLILGLGLAIGFISGMFGIGGGFLLTPLLILIGIPPAVAVASVPSHMAASSFSGAISYWRKRLVDWGLGFVLLSGAMLGTASGVWFFALLRRFGQLDLFIALAYIVLLTIVGTMTAAESLRAIVRSWRGTPPILRRPGTHAWFHGLPFKLRFRQSRIYVSAVPVTVIGFAAGFIGAVMGVGGGFLLVPALIYLMRVPTTVAVGTSLFLTLMTMLVATVLHAIENRTVDAVLALVLMLGGVFGAQFGARAGQAIRAEQLRLLLGILIIAVGVRVAADLVSKPVELFSVVPKEIWE